MNSKVIVVSDENGNVIRQSKNPELGYVRLTQDRITINEKGWVNKKTFSTLLKGRIEDLKAMGIDKINQMPGNIIVKESTAPFNTTDPNRDLKIAGDTGVILCTEDGEPIYRTTIYDASGCMNDILVPHANGDEIKAKINSTPKKTEIESIQKEISFDNLTNNNEFEKISKFIKKEEEEKVEDEEEFKEEFEEVEDFEDDIEFDL